MSVIDANWPEKSSLPLQTKGMRDFLILEQAAFHQDTMGLVHTLSTMKPEEQLKYLVANGPALGALKSLEAALARTSTLISVEAALMDFMTETNVRWLSTVTGWKPF